MTSGALAQAADWTNAIWRVPQGRHLLADMTLHGAKINLDRKYAAEERVPGSIEAIRLWDAAPPVVNRNDFERRWLTHKYGKEDVGMRVVHRGNERTVPGTEVLLTSDYGLDAGVMREVLGHLPLGARRGSFEGRARRDASVAEALRRWNAGSARCRPITSSAPPAGRSGSFFAEPVPGLTRSPSAATPGRPGPGQTSASWLTQP